MSSTAESKTRERSVEQIDVLHVDDEPSFTDLTATYLEREIDHIEVITATSASDALDRLADEQIDCIVSDFDMPGRNGLEFLEAVRAEYGDLPFILFTGKGSEEIASKAIETGVDAYLQKESGTDQYTILANRIQTHVEQHRERGRADRLEEEYALVAEVASDAFWVHDLSTATVRWEGLQSFGYDETSTDRDWWIDRLHPDDRERIIQFHDSLLDQEETAFDEVTAERGRFSTEYRLRRGNGTYARCVGRGILLFEDGQPVKVVGTISDITDHRKQRQELRKTRQQLEAVVEATPAPVYMWDLDGDCLLMNSHMKEMLGLEERDVIGENMFDLVPERYAEIWHANDQKVVEHGETIEREENVPTDDGHQTYLSLLSPVYDADGEPYATCGVSTDITEHKEHERKLQQERDRFRAVFEKSFDAMVITDDDGQYIAVNDSATELFGLPEEELLGRSIAEFAPENFDFEVAWQKFQASEAERGTFPLIRSDGTERVVEYAATTNIVPGQHLSVLRDITEREERETQLRESTVRLEALYENSPDMIDVLDTDGRLLNVNQRFCEALDYTEDELRGRPIWEIDQLVDEDDVHSLLSDFAVGERRKFDGRYERRDGSTVPVEVHLLRLNLTGEDRFLAISRDITERKAYEQSLEQQNKRLDDFASIVSHDLRNPLTVAEGHLELAREECDSRSLEYTANAIDRSQALIDDLLTLAREGEAVRETESVALADIVETCWRNVATDEATLTIATDQMIRADRSRLQQLLENLIRNAISHGGADITVTVGELDDGTGFYVADDGHGIPEDERDNVFESGYSTSAEGTGLGLAIVEGIVTAHGWEIRVTNSSNGGARFEITATGELNENKC